MNTQNLDVEKGPTQVDDQRISSSTSNAGIQHNGHFSASATPLSVFQTLIGIKTDSHLGGPEQPVRPRLRIRRIFFPPKTVGGCNIGLYQRAINEEWKNRIAYFASSYILDTTYILQILLAATFTALSAYKDSFNVPLTTLGAINTVVAGILAWLKGQGIPIRFRRARDQYANIVKEIEVTERLFAEIDQLIFHPELGDERLDPRKEADRLTRMFDTARLDQQNNYPDMYVSSQATAERLAGNEDFRKDVRKKSEEVKADFIKSEQKLLERLRVLEAALKIPRVDEGSVSASSAL